MTPIGRKILETLVNGSTDEAALRDLLPSTSPQVIAVAIRGLKVEGLIRKNADGVLELCNPSPVSLPAATEFRPDLPQAADPQPPKESDTMAKKECGKCGGIDFTSTGRCRKCQKVANEAFRAKATAAKGGKSAKVLPPPRQARSRGRSNPRAQTACRCSCTAIA
jgi:hypothetical protein